MIENYKEVDKLCEDMLKNKVESKVKLEVVETQKNTRK